jgi:hypothetical protein
MFENLYNVLENSGKEEVMEILDQYNTSKELCNAGKCMYYGVLPS